MPGRAASRPSGGSAGHRAWLVAENLPFQLWVTRFDPPLHAGLTSLSGAGLDSACRKAAARGGPLGWPRAAGQRAAGRPEPHPRAARSTWGNDTKTLSFWELALKTCPAASAGAQREENGTRFKSHGPEPEVEAGGMKERLAPELCAGPWGCRPLATVGSWPRPAGAGGTSQPVTGSV